MQNGLGASAQVARDDKVAGTRANEPRAFSKAFSFLCLSSVQEKKDIAWMGVIDIFLKDCFLFFVVYRSCYEKKKKRLNVIINKSTKELIRKFYHCRWNVSEGRLNRLIDATDPGFIPRRRRNLIRIYTWSPIQQNARVWLTKRLKNIRWFICRKMFAYRVL